ncbi:hypothetical protein CPRG_00149 [Synechococcus phage Syn30]|uniref:Ferrochelatase n=1 Tax=Synechococcus phage Syn30 TaxID=536474 RepID=M4SJU4_9CAUD|nr:ferrochelatase [Synechococcus phage Syn30]AGH56233.1 hypothetical protein CPRG_00149 [Synechococcus phage Syn30]|tara:strand:- start:1456 stop:2055 length:600 start_codon:yes stop_codon:yes gene_type:complete
MNKQLLENNYIIVPGFIPAGEALDIAQRFREEDAIWNYPGDDQAPNSASKYNQKDALELLCNQTLQVSNVLGTYVLPSYCYSRIYREDSVLARHMDRPSCEISVTLHLDGDVPWTIYIENSKGEPQSVMLGPGDAMIYLGCIAPHWRDRFFGKEYIQSFLHYVRSDGCMFDNYFDKMRDMNVDSIGLKETLIREYDALR